MQHLLGLPFEDGHNYTACSIYNDLTYEFSSYKYFIKFTLDKKLSNEIRQDVALSKF